MTEKTALERCVDGILENWNRGKGHCNGCPYNLVAMDPDFAYGDPHVEVLAVGQNPGDWCDEIRVLGEDPYDSGDFFFAAINDETEKYPLIKNLRAMTQETRFKDFAGLYFTNLVKCHSSDKDNSSLKRAIGYCHPYLKEEIQISKPMLIVAYGEFAYEGVRSALNMEPDSRKIKELHCSIQSTPNSQLEILVFQHWGRRKDRGYKDEISVAFREHAPR